MLSLTSQQEDVRVTEISIRYQSTFATLPELYRILILDRKIEEISPITNTSVEPSRIKTKKNPKKKWMKIKSFIESNQFQYLNSSSEQGIDGAFYSLTSKYENGQTKTLKIWSGDATPELKEFYNQVKN